MHENDFYGERPFDNDNYKKWRMEHIKAFGALFENAFSQNETAQICLTAASNHILQRNFDMATQKLRMLEQLCDNESDETAVYYFTGLNYELLGDETMMTEYYEKLKNVSVLPPFSLAFHPYYRTAKFAQRECECSKAMYYYRKALEFYDGVRPDSHVASMVSHIIYDIATLCLYMHEYEKCEHFLKYSYVYDKSPNQQRDYIKAILFAVQGKRDECVALVKKMNLFLQGNCQAITDAIFSGRDPHYCVVRQDRSLYQDFWTSFSQDIATIKNMVMNDNFDEAEQIISQKLTKALGFMNRTLDCLIEKTAEGIVIRCKNYRVKSLIAEYAALFALKPANLSSWNFVSVEEFEDF